MDYYFFKQKNKPINFIASWDEDAKRIFGKDEDVTLMSIEEFSINLELLEFFNLVDMYAKSYHKNTPISENLIDVLFSMNTNSATLYDCVDFMRHYLADFKLKKPIEFGATLMICREKKT